MLKLERSEELAVLTIDRPEAVNAISFGLLESLDRILDGVAKDDIRALIVTGSGTKAFCAGADIAELANRRMIDERAGSRAGQKVFEKLNGLRVPTIAAINGYAFGGGLELALACTFRVAASTAKMGLPEIKLGLIPGYGGTQRLPRLVGEGVALDMILTGRAVGAEEALQFGLINRVADGDVLEAAKAFARQFTCFGLPALELAREAVGRSFGVALSAGLEIEADLSTLAYRTADGQIGLEAFAGKRTPEFVDA